MRETEILMIASLSDQQAKAHKGRRLPDQEIQSI
jgi:hypothetical protein